LPKHEEEIKFFLKQNFIVILLISKTHFTTKNYFSTPRYKLYYTNHPDGTAHGGTAILIKETIKHYELLKYEEDSIQAMLNESERISILDNHHTCLLPTLTQSKKGTF